MRRRVLLGGLAALFALALIAGYSATRPVPVVIDGQPQVLTAGATAGDLQTGQMLSAASGDLVSVKGEVLEPGGGAPPVVMRNNEAVPASARLFGGDDIESRPGADMIESVEVTLTPLPFKTVFEGSGSLSELTTEGVVGQARITRGKVSGTQVTRVVLKAPVDAVVKRTHPAPGARMVALTFDDGPWPLYTEQILDVLRDHDAHATFFMLGVRVKRKPEVARRLVREGHLAANHSLSHRSFATASAKETTKQIVKGREVTKQFTGVDTPWLRPPYGAMDAAAWKIAKRTGSRVVRWTVDSEDWKRPGAGRIAKRVVKQVKPGSVVLFHDGGGDRSQTVAALPVIIEQLRAKGYVFVTVEELYAVKAEQQVKR